MDVDLFVKEATRHFDESLNDLEMYMLKSHIFIENRLTMYIEKVTKNRIVVDNCNFTFIQKIKIAKMIGSFDGISSQRRLEHFLIQLNILRNTISHGHNIKPDYIPIREIVNAQGYFHSVKSSDLNAAQDLKV